MARNKRRPVRSGAVAVAVLLLLLATAARGQEAAAEEEKQPQQEEQAPLPPPSPSLSPPPPSPSPSPPPPPPPQQQQDHQDGQSSDNNRDSNREVSAFASSGGVCGNANAALLEVLSRAPEAPNSSSSSSNGDDGAVLVSASSSSSPPPAPAQNTCAALVAVERMGLAARGCHVVVISNQGPSPVFGWSLSLAPDTPRAPLAAEGATLVPTAAAAGAAAPRLISYPGAPALQPGGRAAFVLKLDDGGEDNSSNNNGTLGRALFLNGGRCFFQPPPPSPPTPLHLTGDYEFGSDGAVGVAHQPSGDLYCCASLPPSSAPPPPPPPGAESSSSPPSSSAQQNTPAPPVGGSTSGGSNNINNSNSPAPEVAPLFVAVSVAVPVGLLLGVAAAAALVLVVRRASARRRRRGGGVGGGGGLPCWRKPEADGDSGLGEGTGDGAPAPSPALPPASGGEGAHQQQQPQPPLPPAVFDGRRHASAPPTQLMAVFSSQPLARASMPSSSTSGRSSLLRHASAPAAAPALAAAAAEAAAEAAAAAEAEAAAAAAEAEAAAAAAAAPSSIPPGPPLPPLPERTISQPHPTTHHLGLGSLPTAIITRAGSSSSALLLLPPSAGSKQEAGGGSKGAAPLGLLHSGPPQAEPPQPRGLAALARSRGWLGQVRLVFEPSPPPPTLDDEDDDDDEADEADADDANDAPLTDPPPPFEELVTLHERLGSGAHGTVWRCSWRGRRGTAAAKVIPLPDSAALRAARREVATLARAAPHPHVVRFLGAGLCVDGVGGDGGGGAQAVVVLQPWARGGSLARALAPGGAFACSSSSADAWARLRVGADVAVGLAALHAQGIIHRDIKPGNILLDLLDGIGIGGGGAGGDRSGGGGRSGGSGSSSSSPPAPAPAPIRARLADFGVAALTRSAGQATATATRAGLLGTPCYLAPECFHGGGGGGGEGGEEGHEEGASGDGGGHDGAPPPPPGAADVYALGLVLWQLLLSPGEPPWLGLSHLQVVFAVAVAGERPPRPAWVDEGDERWRLVERCWRAEPAARPSAAAVARELEAMMAAMEEEGAEAPWRG